MSGQESRESPIKTPAQLALVVILGFAVPVIAALLLAYMVAGASKSDRNNPAYSEEATAARIRPVASVNLATDAPGPASARNGEAVYKAVCAACHETGAAGAPKVGDKTAWAKRIKEGLSQLTREAITGVRAMPPRGGNPDLSDIEIARAVAYMANLSGASFQEPVAPGAAAVPKRTGEQIVQATCAPCHATGAGGAPKMGDKAAWAARIKGGIDSLYASAIKGKNAMPPKGGNAALDDAEVRAAVDYLASLAR